jgi:hypothetical protein
MPLRVFGGRLRALPNKVGADFVRFDNLLAKKIFCHRELSTPNKILSEITEWKN